jgi:hypothetical protein
MFSDADWAVAEHEAAHTTAALLAGFAAAVDITPVVAGRNGRTQLDLRPSIEALVESDPDEAWVRVALIALAGYRMRPRPGAANTSDWATVEEAIEKLSPERRRDAWPEIGSRLSSLIGRTDFQALHRRLTVELLRREIIDFDGTDEILAETLGNSERN